MRLRIALTALIAAGALLFSGANAFAASALSDTTSAVAAQYGLGAVAGANVGGAADVDEVGFVAANVGEESGVAPAAANEAGALGAGLPFTGYAAISLLALGLVLLASGLVVRRTQRAQPA